MSQSPTEPSPVILSEIVDAVGVITLNRPDRRNALNSELIDALHDAVARFADDAAVRVVVLTGAAAPGRHGGFCSGGDVKDGGSSPNGVPRGALDGDLSRHDHHAAMRLHLMPKPTIAMVGGPAVGAGLSLAAACDLRIASSDATFTAKFASNGLSGDYGGTFWLTAIAGSAVVRELYLLNEPMSADDALRRGLVTRVVEPDALRQATMDLAAQLARLPGAVARRVKDNINQAEVEVGRRRWLFANEAENQIASGADIAARLARRSR